MFAFQLLHQRAQVGGGADGEPLNQAGLLSVLRRNHQGLGLLLLGRLFGEGNHPATGPEAAVESQFARTPEALQLRAGELPAGHQQGQGDGEVKGGGLPCADRPEPG